jgi:hypothetical protein
MCRYVISGEASGKHQRFVVCSHHLQLIYPVRNFFSIPFRMKGGLVTYTR